MCQYHFAKGWRSLWEDRDRVQITHSGCQRSPVCERSLRVSFPADL